MSASRNLVLLVEDERLVSDLLEIVLNDEGFDVAVAYDGDSAITLLQAHAQELRAVITDIDLGRGPDGWSVATEARRLRPELPVIYMSGGSAAQWPSRGLKKTTLLPKPFPPRELIAAIASALAAGAS